MNYLCWIDLETEGLDPRNHRILEVGIVVTTDKLVPLLEESYVIRQHDVGDMSGYVYNMHTKSGLLAECAGPDAVRVADAESALWRISHSQHPAKMTLAGNSVHFDKEFLRQWMPGVLDQFNYRMLDVSALKFAAAQLGIPEPKKGLAHRALADIYESIEEYRYYLKAFGGK